MTSRDDKSVPALSIVLVSWNCWSDLHKCLRSLYDSDIEDFEIVVVDNASSDGTPEKLRENFPEVNVHVNSTNEEYSRGANKGFSLVRGRFVLLIDSDTEIPRGTIVELMTFLAERSDVAMVAPRTLNTDGTIQESARNFPSAINALFGRQSYLTHLFPNNPFSRRYLARDRLQATSPFQVDQVGSACMLFRRSLLDEIGGFDEVFKAYWGDADWCMKIKRVGKKIYCVPQVSIYHHEGLAKGKKKKTSRIWIFHLGAYRFYTRWYARGVMDPRSLFAGLALTSRAVVITILNSFASSRPPLDSGALPQGRSRGSSI